MRLLRPLSASRRLSACVALVLCASAGLTAVGAQGQGFGGEIRYTGSRGPVGQQRPLCLCVYTDPELSSGLGCLLFDTSPARYRIDRLTGDYYLVAFVDLHVNERLDADEPFEIYRDRGAPPADPVAAHSGNMDIDFVFGDENLPGAPTPTATPSPETTGSASPSPTPAPSFAGDCDGNGVVTIDELVRGVAIALETMNADACLPADVDGDGAVSVDELILAVNAALGRSAG